MAFFCIVFSVQSPRSPRFCFFYNNNLSLSVFITILLQYERDGPVLLIGQNLVGFVSCLVFFFFALHTKPFTLLSSALPFGCLCSALFCFALLCFAFFCLAVRSYRWHPGPGGHVLVADMLFMHYGRALLRAIDRLEAASPGLSAYQLREKKKQHVMSALREAVGLGEGNKNVR